MKRNQPFYYIALYIFLVAIFFAHYFVSGQAVYGDGIGHYAYLHSWYFDGDNDFTNEYQHIYNFANNNSLAPNQSELVQIVGTNSAGKALNHFSPGMAILLLPFYVLADGIVMVANLFGANLARNGYSNVYQLVVGMGAVFYVVVAVWLSEKFLMLFDVGQWASRVAVLTLLMATQLLYYGSFDVLNSHFVSFLLVVWFFYYFFKYRTQLDLQKYFWLGVIVSLMFLTRPQDGVVVAVVLVDAFLTAKNSRKFWQTFWPQLAAKLSAFFLPIAVGVSLLATQWLNTFDSFDTHPYFMWMVGKDSLVVASDLLGTLFHFTNGLFFRTPILLLAMLMFAHLIHRKKVSYELSLLAMFFFLQYLIIFFQGGWKAAAYGGRMYISSLPFFLVLIAKLFVWVKTKHSTLTLWLLISFLISLNILSVFSFVLLEKGTSGNRKGIELYTKARLLGVIN
jgi:hypothetical protein